MSRPPPRWLAGAWVAFVTMAMVVLDWLPLVIWGWAIPLAAALLLVFTAPMARSVDWIRTLPGPRAIRRSIAVSVSVCSGAHVGMERRDHAAGAAISGSTDLSVVHGPEVVAEYLAQARWRS